MQKIKLILQLVREILQFKYPAFWLVEKILDHNINLSTIFTDTEFAKKKHMDYFYESVWKTVK